MELRDPYFYGRRARQSGCTSSMDVRVLRRYGLIDSDGAFNSECQYLGFIDGCKTLRKLDRILLISSHINFGLALILKIYIISHTSTSELLRN